MPRCHQIHFLDKFEYGRTSNWYPCASVLLIILARESRLDIWDRGCSCHPSARWSCSLFRHDDRKDERFLSHPLIEIIKHRVLILRFFRSIWSASGPSKSLAEMPRWPSSLPVFSRLTLTFDLPLFQPITVQASRINPNHGEAPSKEEKEGFQISQGRGPARAGAAPEEY